MHARKNLRTYAAGESCSSNRYTVRRRTWTTLEARTWPRSFAYLCIFENEEKKNYIKKNASAV